MHKYSFVEKITVIIAIHAIIVGVLVLFYGIKESNGMISFSGAFVMSASIISLAIVANKRNEQ